jgi:RNA polymerase sigma-70 factor (ECF subfamily)
MVERSTTSNANTHALVLRARAGDRDAFEAMARHFLRPAYSVALAIVRRPADAEDVAQDALILAFERLDTCRDLSRFTAWLMTIVRNQARNWLDKRRLRDVLPKEPEEGAAPFETAEISVERDKLLRALDGLSEVEREVVLLHDLEGFTHEEIGQVLGISCVMSRQHLFISRRKLRRTLDIEAGQGGNDE